MSFNDSVFYKEIGGVLGHQRVLLCRRTCLTVSAIIMFFKADKQFVLRWIQFGVKTHIFILLESILEFTLIMATTALKV